MHGCSAISTVAFWIVCIVIFAIKPQKNAFILLKFLNDTDNITSYLTFALLIFFLTWRKLQVLLYFVWLLCLKRYMYYVIYFDKLVRSNSEGRTHKIGIVSDVWSVYDISIAYLLDSFTIVMTGWNESGRRVNVWKIRNCQNKSKMMGSWQNFRLSSSALIAIWMNSTDFLFIFCLTLRLLVCYNLCSHLNRFVDIPWRKPMLMR